MSTTTKRTRTRIIIELPYETSDLYLAAYLAVMDCRFSGTKDREDRPGLLFLFEDKERATQLARAWMLQEDPPVSARAYSQQVKRLKNIIIQGGIS